MVQIFVVYSTVGLTRMSLATRRIKRLKAIVFIVSKMGSGIYLKRIQVLLGQKCLIISDNLLYHNFEAPRDEIEVLGRVVISHCLGSS